MGSAASNVESPYRLLHGIPFVIPCNTDWLHTADLAQCSSRRKSINPFLRVPQRGSHATAVSYFALDFLNLGDVCVMVAESSPTARGDVSLYAHDLPVCRLP